MISEVLKEHFFSIKIPAITETPEVSGQYRQENENKRFPPLMKRVPYRQGNENKR